MASTTVTKRPASTKSGTLPAPRRFTFDEFYRMAMKGILRPDERVELLEGEIIQMSPIGSRHMACVNDFTEWFVIHLAGRAIVSIQNAIHLSWLAAPQPDLVLLRPRPGRYREALPTPEDVLLLIEVSDTTLRYDRGRKLPLYAKAGIAEVWIVDLRGKRVFVYRGSSGDGYEQTMIVPRDGSLTPLAFPDLALPVAELLG